MTARCWAADSPETVRTIRPEFGPLGAGDGESEGAGLREVSLGEGAGESAGEGESDGEGDGESDGAGDGESVEDCESDGAGLGESVEVDDELFESANADTAPAGPAMIDATMQTTRMNALAVFLIANAAPVRLAPDRPNKLLLLIVPRAGVAAPRAEPGMVPIRDPPLHETDK
jgi:hypothetical protein